MRYEIRPRTFNAGVPLMYEWPIYDVEADRQVGLFTYDQQQAAILTCERMNREVEREETAVCGEPFYSDEGERIGACRRHIGHEGACDPELVTA